MKTALTLALLVATNLVATAAQAQIFVANVTGGPQDRGGTIGEYSLDGTAIAAPLISTGLAGPRGMAVAGASLFVANDNGEFGGWVGEYTTSGIAIHPQLISTITSLDVAVTGQSLFVSHGANVGKYTQSSSLVSEPFIASDTLLWGVALSGDGSRLFVAGFDDNTIGEYDASSGAIVNASLITGLNAPTGIFISGNDLFVANSGNGTVGKYHLDGAIVNPALVSGLSNPQDVAELGGSLYVADTGNGRIGQYDAASGAAINASLITGFSYAGGIVVVPEPSTKMLLTIGCALLTLLHANYRAAGAACMIKVRRG